MLFTTAFAEGTQAAANILETWWLPIQSKIFANTPLNFFETLYKEIYMNLISNNRWFDYLKGLGITLEVSLFASVFGLMLGLVLCLMKMSKNKPLSFLSSAYIHLIRSTPMLLQVMLINFGVFAAIKVDKVFVGVLACGLNSAAYVAELIRGGILSVDKGQTEAGRSLGLSSFQTMIFIVLPQAMKTALPSLCNEFIVLIKETSVLAYIALSELTKAADYIRSRTFSAFTPYIVSGLLYLIVISVFTKLIGVIERRLRESDNR